jgi:hypothetical protein
MVYRNSPALIEIKNQIKHEIVPHETYFIAELLQFHSRSTGKRF